MVKLSSRFCSATLVLILLAGCGSPSEPAPAMPRALTAAETADLVAVPEGPVKITILDADTLVASVSVDAAGNFEVTGPEDEGVTFRYVDERWFWQVPAEEAPGGIAAWVRLPAGAAVTIFEALIPAGSAWEDIAAELVNTELEHPAYCLADDEAVATAVTVDNGWEYSCTYTDGDGSEYMPTFSVTTDDRGRLASIEGMKTVLYDYDPSPVTAPGTIEGPKADRWIADTVALLTKDDLISRIATTLDEVATRVMSSADPGSSDQRLLELAWTELGEENFYGAGNVSMSQDSANTVITVATGLPGTPLTCEGTLKFTDGRSVRPRPVCARR